MQHQTHQQKNHPQKQEISAGLVIFRRTEDGPKYLILYHRGSYWNFPKGKLESEERSFDAALRETSEETGIKGHNLRLLKGFQANERYSFRGREGKVFKIVIFYLAETRSPHVQLSDEHQGYGWFLYRDGMKILEKHKESQNILRRAHAFINPVQPARSRASRSSPISQKLRRNESRK